MVNKGRISQNAQIVELEEKDRINILAICGHADEADFGGCTDKGAKDARG